jgi:hypothetical protein
MIHLKKQYVAKPFQTLITHIFADLLRFTRYEDEREVLL